MTPGVKCLSYLLVYCRLNLQDEFNINRLQSAASIVSIDAHNKSPLAAIYERRRLLITRSLLNNKQGISRLFNIRTGQEEEEEFMGNVGELFTSPYQLIIHKGNKSKSLSSRSPISGTLYA